MQPQKKIDRRNFSWLAEFGGRTFTKRLSLQVCRRLIAMLPFTLAKDPKQPMENFVEAQAIRLQKLAKKAKRARMTNADETQLYVLTPGSFLFVV